MASTSCMASTSLVRSVGIAVVGYPEWVPGDEVRAARRQAVDEAWDQLPACVRQMRRPSEPIGP